MQQQIPEGYKQSEVGVIPKDWDVMTLKGIASSVSVGLVINPSSYFDEKGTVPMLVGSTVKENKINRGKANCITEESNRKIPASRLSEGDLVTVRVGEPGITAVIPPELDGCNCASMMIVRKKGTFNSTWLCFLMNSDLGISQIKNVQYGTAQKQFNISDAASFLYPFPALKEQTAIANALSDVDALITSLEKLIAKKRAIKTAAMQQLLTGKKRLPPFDQNHTGYKQTELGEIPEDWEVGLIGDSAELITKGTTPMTIGRSFVQAGITFVKVESVIENGTFDRSKFAYIDEGTDRLLVRSRISAGDLLVSIAGALGRAIIATQDILPANTNQALAIIRFKKAANVSSRFVFHFTKSNFFAKHIEATSSQGAQPNLSLGDISDFPIVIPNIDEQVLIVETLNTLDSEITALEQRLNKTQQLKQGMMQELLTGRTRLI